MATREVKEQLANTWGAYQTVKIGVWVAYFVILYMVTIVAQESLLVVSVEILALYVVYYVAKVSQDRAIDQARLMGFDLIDYMVNELNKEK